MTGVWPKAELIVFFFFFLNENPHPLYNGYPLSAYEWWIYVNRFWHLMGGTGKQLDTKWVKTQISPVTILPAQSGPSVDIKTESPICLSSTGSRPTIHWTVAVAHPHLMTFVISIPLQTVSSSSLAGEEAERRQQSLPFTLGYWLSVAWLWQECSALTFWRFVFFSVFSLPFSKLASQKVKLPF